ncbi:FAD dependent oxidoreductase [Gongronella butleri]|nr:FAD dependent oxidoreductase [Gongronella butleri]
MLRSLSTPVSAAVARPLVRRRFSTQPALEIDNVVVGAGVVGLALARRLAIARPDETTLLLEKNTRVGEETSSRNSQVIHAGLYYPETSLKTKLCIQGKIALYELLERAQLPYRKVGKWIVAQDDAQCAYLAQLHEKAQRLGVPTYFLDNAAHQTTEPLVKAQAILVSPSTGIVDVHRLLDYLEQDFQDQNGILALATPVTGITRQTSGLFELATPDATVVARRVFNSAGLYADQVSNMVLPGKYKLHYARGHYYTTPGLAMSRLIYPCPEKNLAGLGTHLTMDLAGQVRFGPDVQYIDSPTDYDVPEDPPQEFLPAIQRYLRVDDSLRLLPDYAGIRPKLAAPGESFRDFVIQHEKDDDMPGFYTLIGIESPGLTSSLAIADYTVNLIDD